MNSIKVIIDKPQKLPLDLCKLVIEKASKDTKIIICGVIDNDNNKSK